jgi:hypothetical protein
MAATKKKAATRKWSARVTRESDARDLRRRTLEKAKDELRRKFRKA